MLHKFLPLIGSKETEKHFFNAVRFKRQQDLTQRKLDHNWEAKGHKLYPSAIKSLTMCPHRFIQEDVHKPSSFTTQVVYSLELGKSVHEMLQTEGLDIPGLYWKDVSYAHYPDEFRLKLEEKRQYIYPEVPVMDPLSGISGQADMILDLGGNPVVLDIKTTSIEDIKTDESKQVIIERNRWASKCAALPSEEHKIQVGIYCHLLNKFKILSKPVRKAGLAYVNMLLKPGDPDAEYEIYFDFTEEFEARIALLVEHLGLERQHYLNGVESECKYQYCRAHNLKKTIKEAKES